MLLQAYLITFLLLSRSQLTKCEKQLIIDGVEGIEVVEVVEAVVVVIEVVVVVVVILK